MSGPREPITVLVGEDHPLFRAAVIRAIKHRAELRFAGEARDGREALAAIKELRPEVAILDVKMPELDGVQVVRAVIRDRLATRVLLLSAFMDGSIVFDAISAGAAGYVSKYAEGDEICDAIVAVAGGETVLAHEIQAGVASEIRARAHVSGPSLTDREHQILVHVSEGRSAPEIAKLLHLSPATVKSYLLNAYEKLGVSDRAAAVAEAMRRGLIE